MRVNFQWVSSITLTLSQRKREKGSVEFSSLSLKLLMIDPNFYSDFRSLRWN
jgi:hypothetical protein